MARTSKALFSPQNKSSMAQEKNQALPDISAILLASPHGFRMDASVLLRVGRRKMDITSHLCPCNSQIKASQNTQKSISLGRADHMTDHMPASAARDVGKGRTWALLRKLRGRRGWSWVGQPVSQGSKPLILAPVTSASRATIVCLWPAQLKFKS